MCFFCPRGWQKVTFAETLAGISTLTQWTSCLGNTKWCRAGELSPLFIFSHFGGGAQAPLVIANTDSEEKLTKLLLKRSWLRVYPWQNLCPSLHSYWFSSKPLATPPKSTMPLVSRLNVNFCDDFVHGLNSVPIKSPRSQISPFIKLHCKSWEMKWSVSSLSNFV